MVQATTYENSVTKMKEVYKVKTLLGKGAFSTVRLASNRQTKEEVAIKIMKKKELCEDDVVGLQNEIQFMTEIDHPAIVSLHEIYEDDDYFCLVLERMHGGELYAKIKELGHIPEAEIHRLMVPVFDALFYCHDLGITHRDLKPENLLLTSNELKKATIKITDFGMSRRVSADEFAETVCGSPGYVAPEVISQKPYD